MQVKLREGEEVQPHVGAPALTSGELGAAWPRALCQQPAEPSSPPGPTASASGGCQCQEEASGYHFSSLRA